MQNITE